MLAACGLVCVALACIGVLGVLLALGVSDASPDRSSFLLMLMAYPAYVFAKWARTAWRVPTKMGEGPGSRIERRIVP
jgi:hypothetical protein